MKFNLFGKEITIGREYYIIGISVLLILLTLWGWYLNTNNVSVFSAGGSPERQKQHTGFDGENTQTISPKSVSEESGIKASDSDRSVSAKEKIININTAGKEELISLNGIGEVKASAIIRYRKENGLFESIEDIKNVNGIGEATFQKIKDKITAGEE